MGENFGAVVPVAPVAGLFKVATFLVADGATPYPNGDIALGAPFLDGAFDPGSTAISAKEPRWSTQFSMGWLHTLWSLSYTAGTPSFKGEIYGRPRLVPATTAGQNTPTYGPWAAMTSNGIAGGQTVNSANFPNALDATNKLLVWAEPIQVYGFGRQYLPRCTAIVGTTGILTVYMGFSRG